MLLTVESRLLWRAAPRRVVCLLVYYVEYFSGTGTHHTRIFIIVCFTIVAVKYRSRRAVARRFKTTDCFFFLNVFKRRQCAYPGPHTTDDPKRPRGWRTAWFEAREVQGSVSDTLDTYEG